MVLGEKVILEPSICRYHHPMNLAYRNLGIRWTGAATLFEPVTNVRLGVEYLRQLIERYDSVSTALAAYNWGPRRIGGKLRRGEAIPAGYANKVMAKYQRPLSNAI